MILSSTRANSSPIRKVTALLAACVISAAACDVEETSVRNPKPNILLIVADDLGYSDIGAFGSEIETPTIDALARSGARFTNFHTSPNCSPTRAMLLTGVDNHIAGLGNMMELSTPLQREHPGYEGHLNDSVVTISTLLQDAGYRTYISGKWHLGEEPGLLPSDRGFDRSFALVEGAGNHFDQRGYSERYPTVDYVADGNPVSLDDDFYSTFAFTDKMIDFIEVDETARPFFAYLAYTAPHWPLQAPAEAIEKYRLIYAKGWDQVRAERFNRMKVLGLLPESMELPPRRAGVEAWHELDDASREHQATKMAVYAAMISIMDAEIDRLLQTLDDREVLDNTVIIFMSDNGAEDRDLEGYPHFVPWVSANFSHDAVPGSADSFLFAGPGWAQVSSTPHRLGKKSTAEGGLRSPLVIHGVRDQQNAILDAFSHVTDIAVTILDVAGVEVSRGHYRERSVAEPSGRSLLPYLSGDADTVYSDNDAVGFELNGTAAIFRGDRKALRLAPPFGDNTWSLYNMVKDPAELNDRADAEPGELNSLIDAYEKYASRVGVISQ